MAHITQALLRQFFKCSSWDWLININLTCVVYPTKYIKTHFDKRSDTLFNPSFSFPLLSLPISFHFLSFSFYLSFNADGEQCLVQLPSFRGAYGQGGTQGSCMQSMVYVSQFFEISLGLFCFLVLNPWHLFPLLEWSYLSSLIGKFVNSLNIFITSFVTKKPTPYFISKVPSFIGLLLDHSWHCGQGLVPVLCSEITRECALRTMGSARDWT